MLSLLVTHIIITASCLLSGVLLYNFFSKNIEAKPTTFYLISGLVLLTSVTQMLTLFFPIGSYIQLFVFAFLFLALLLKWNTYKNIFRNILSGLSSWSVLSTVLFFISWAIILLINAGPVIMDDTESYHIQSIKWIQEYGSVPGLVNLHERFGFNTSWFGSIALFNLFPNTTGGFTALNSVISLWLCYCFISKYEQYKKENNFSAAFAIVVIFICCLVIWPLIRGNAATANYDFITTLIVLILFVEIFFSKQFSPSAEWIIWPAYLFTVRIINFPLLSLSLIGLIYLIKQKNVRSLLFPIAYSLLLIIPFAVRNIIISGYPFYPSTSFDMTSVDWKPDPQMTERLLEYIKYYNRVSTTYLEIEQTKALGPNWIPSWFGYLFLFDKLLVAGGTAGIILSIIKLFIQKNRTTLSVISVCIGSIICWFILFPDPRFIYGILVFGIFLLVYHFILWIKNIQIIKVAANILIIAIIIGSSYYFISKLWKQNEYRNWLLPVKLPQPPVKEFIIDGITFRIPEPINNNWNARCYGTELPCLYKIDPRLKPRGKNIRDGFRLEK